MFSGSAREASDEFGVSVTTIRKYARMETGTAFTAKSVAHYGISLFVVNITKNEADLDGEEWVNFPYLDFGKPAVPPKPVRLSSLGRKRSQTGRITNYNGRRLPRWE